MKTVFGVLAVSLTVAATSWAAGVEAPRPAGPVVVADFETPDSVALWSGLPCTQTNTHASSGANGMRFSIPKYVEGQEQRPGVYLGTANKGLPFSDFGPYKAVIVDVWVEGDQPGKMGLALRDKDGEKSWTTHITVEPGKVNHAELPMAEAGADSDIHNVAEVQLYALRPETAYTLVVDNLRLIPRDPDPIAQFDLVYPNYRGLVFPGEEEVEVSAKVAAQENGLRPQDLVVTLSLDTGAAHKTVKKSASRADGRFTMPVDTLWDAPATLTGAVARKSGCEVLAGRQWTVRKLTVAQRDALRVYVDRHNTTIVDGKPFFPLGWYSSTKEEYLAEVADSPFNTILAYGTDNVPRDTMLRYLDLMQEKGLKLIYCMNDVYPTAEYFKDKKWEGVTGNDAISAAVVAAYRNSPAVLAWYLNDELPHKLVPQLEDYYQRTAAADPSRPCFIVLCNKSELPYFPTTTDIMGVDPYPIPKDPITRVSSFVDKAKQAVNDHKPVWLVPQAFGWYQYNSKDKDRGHTPTEAELKDGRAPTYEEERCMTYLGLVHGAKGLIYYCYYDMRVLPQYPEMWGWMKKIAGEVKELAPVLLSPEDLGAVTMTPKDAPVHTRLMRHDGRLYLIAVNSDRAACHVRFDLKRPLPSQVTVMFENRTVPAHRARLEADFAPLEAHVYDLGPGK
ncbi:MAG: hypothetical protein HZB26_14720 [Candidatus Hydrogenedentes bacterium]|nr:hypothetical protein [Candidatus Hydrogenedentota bacterium]